MQLTAEHLKNAVYAVAIALVCAVLYLLVQSSMSTHRQVSTAKPATAVKPHTKTATKQIRPKKHYVSAVQKRNLSLRQQVGRFFWAYEQLNPTDTQQIRRQRLSSIVPQQVINQLDLTVDRKSVAGRARIKNQLTIRGAIVLQRFLAAPVGQDPNQLVVRVPVKIVVYAPNGKVANKFDLPTTSVWRYIQRRWVLQKVEDS